jgi:predicted nucleic acid-binding protein
MDMPDVNVLVHAHRREDPDHEFYRTWLEQLAHSPQE